MTATDPEASVREFYAAIDEDRYERLRSLLAPAFTQDRPDRTFDTPEAFVRFMRDDRPMTETTHELDGLYSHGTDLAAQGRLLDASGEVLFSFVDVFAVEDGLIAHLRTYTD
jgi:ketosteroid isomerase-like protein